MPPASLILIALAVPLAVLLALAIVLSRTIEIKAGPVQVTFRRPSAKRRR